MSSNTTPNAYDVFAFILIIYGLFEARTRKKRNQLKPLELRETTNGLQ